ncbi:MAG: cysteine--tRNA ligase [Desulfobulbaceae bacterium A2]|nr:MAG: cysteine--tRNA ligase [Desulfobulbaceae bacterium A2]
MPIHIYNTLSRAKEVLQPLEENHVRLYVCGITAYDYCHIGHARSALVFDLITRYLRYRGYRVTYVRNFTDIDDKIIRRAQETGDSPQALAERFIDAFHEDMERLGVLLPDIEPRATEHIPEMIALVQELIDKGLAYPAGGDVFFAIDRFPPYGALSGRGLEEMQAGARIEINEVKRHPMDFVLWKGSKPGEPAWPSPWGEGRPGWHLECSAMSRKYLGEQFDIHGGGQDLVFPHHENEIAQSHGACGQAPVRTWIHHGYVTIRGDKMAKSVGNFLTIRQVLADWHPEVLRLFIFSTHYRNPVDYAPEALRDAEAALTRLYECLAAVARLPTEGAGQREVASAAERERIAALPARFEQAMDNDFHSAQALAVLFDGLKLLNRVLHALSPQPAAADLALLRQGGASLRELAGVLGLVREEPVVWLAARQARLLAAIDLKVEEIEVKLQQRRAARARKDFAAGDAIRDWLASRGIEIKDGPGGTNWQVREK